MKKLLYGLIITVGMSHITATAQTTSGDETTACEIILCLSASARPAQCTPPIQKFLSIVFRNPADTINARKNFLRLCPVAIAGQIDFLVLSTTFGQVGSQIGALELLKYDEMKGEIDKLLASNDTYNQHLIANIKPRMLEIEIKLERIRIGDLISEYERRLQSVSFTQYGEVARLKKSIKELKENFETKYGIRY